MCEEQTTPTQNACTTCEYCVNCGHGHARSNSTNGPRSHRKHQGGGLKLSWPRANDSRRAVVSKAPQLPTGAKISDARFIHASHWDIDLYRSLTSPVSAYTLSSLNVPTVWNPSELEALDRDLFGYFCSVASASLATYGYDATALGEILARIALGGQTASATAVLKALLAFSSLQRYGVQTQAVELKIAALRSLGEGSAEPSLGAKEAIQHAAAGMLLCSFEVHQSSCTSGQWTGYLGGVKTVVNAASVEKLLRLGPDVAVLLDWVHYHDVLARFSLLHWKREGAPELSAAPIYLSSSQVFNSPPLVFSMLDLLSQVCDAVSSHESLSGTRDDVNDYKGFLKILDWRIRSLPMPKITGDNDNTSGEATLILQLYQLAMLVYLDRSSEGLIDQPIRTQQHIENAFAILPLLSSCTQQFPIHVIGCEARTDEQRAVLLDLISRTEGMNSSRSFNYCKGILQAVWAQDDLAYGNNVSYRDKLTSVMSRCVVVPSFV